MTDFPNIPSCCPHCGTSLTEDSNYGKDTDGNTIIKTYLICENSECDEEYSYYVGSTTEQEVLDEMEQYEE